MENNENFVAEQVAENVEQTTEQPPKMYTEDELNAKVNEVAGKRAARKEAKIRREVDETYGPLMDMLRSATGKQSAEEITEDLRQHFQGSGKPALAQPAGYTDKEAKILASAEAKEIIEAGDEEVKEELERLTAKGAGKMTAKEKAIFKVLAAHRQTRERSAELAKLGVGEDVANSPEFVQFASRFKSDTPIQEIYNLYEQTKPKEEAKPMGSMKSNPGDDGGVKDYYTPDEARKFTVKDYNDRPGLYEAVVRSMRKWKK